MATSPSRRRVRRRWLVLAALLVPAAAGWGALAAMEPSNERDWVPDNAVLPAAEVRGDTLRVSGVRNARYATTDSFTVAYETRAYDLRTLRTAWFGVEPFEKGWEGPAHTWVSFGFDDGRYLAVSVEIRREKGESFSPLKGLLNQFEVIYVVGDERDVIGLRANHRRDEVYLYPIRATPERVRAMLLGMMARANRLREQPEFYNTLTNTCTTNLVRHVNEVAPRRIGADWRILLPGYSDRLAYEEGLIDTDLPFEEARRRFHVNARAARWADSPEFSRRIREAE